MIRHKVRALLALVACAFMAMLFSCVRVNIPTPGLLTLEAQTFPWPLQADVDAPAAVDNVVSMKVMLNAVVNSQLPISQCTPVTPATTPPKCTLKFLVAAPGTYAMTYVWTNQALSTDPNSLQDSQASAALTFAVKQVPPRPADAPTNLKSQPTP